MNKIKKAFEYSTNLEHSCTFAKNTEAFLFINQLFMPYYIVH